MYQHRVMPISNPIHVRTVEFDGPTQNERINTFLKLFVPILTVPQIADVSCFIWICNGTLVGLDVVVDVMEVPYDHVFQGALEADEKVPRKCVVGVARSREPGGERRRRVAD